MSDPKHAPDESVRDFVVETTVKPDGRRIHYYEWPDRPPESGGSKPEPDKAAGTERSRV